MKDVDIEQPVDTAEVTVKIKKQKSDKGKVSFMEDRNAKRKANKLDPAYSKEEINAYR